MTLTTKQVDGFAVVAAGVVFAATFAGSFLRAGVCLQTDVAAAAVALSALAFFGFRPLGRRLFAQGGER